MDALGFGLGATHLPTRLRAHSYEYIRAAFDCGVHPKHIHNANAPKREDSLNTSIYPKTSNPPMESQGPQ